MISDVRTEDRIIDDDSRGSLPVAARDEMRRTGGPFTRLSLFGAAFVAALAKTWVDAPDARASPYCCDLWFPNGPWCGGTQGSGNFSCPTGKVKRSWTCCAPAGLVSCWECATGPTCYDGPFSCSNYSIAPGC